MEEILNKNNETSKRREGKNLNPKGTESIMKFSFHILTIFIFSPKIKPKESLEWLHMYEKFVIVQLLFSLSLFLIVDFLKLYFEIKVWWNLVWWHFYFVFRIILRWKLGTSWNTSFNVGCPYSMDSSDVICSSIRHTSHYWSSVS